MQNTEKGKQNSNHFDFTACCKGSIITLGIDLANPLELHRLFYIIDDIWEQVICHMFPLIFNFFYGSGQGYTLLAAKFVEDHCTHGTS